MDNFQDVGAFHKKFGLDSVTEFGVYPRKLPSDQMEFRIKFLEEELDELKKAFAEGNHPEMFDALIDLVYVALGTAHLQGYPWAAGWNAVHYANMSKVRAKPDGSDSARGSSFDVVKPPGWVAPNIEEILAACGWDRVK